jgi:uncharacterized protein with FMN-binding domain
MDMHKSLPAIAGVAALGSSVASTVAADHALAATPKKKVATVKKTVTGGEAQASRWGFVKVTLVIRKTTTTIGTKKKVTRKVIDVKVPEYPNHTDRSVYINTQALPYLEQEVLQTQLNPNIQFVSGATDTSTAFQESLQSAIVAARKA